MGRPAGVKADQCGLRARGPGSGAAGAIFGLPLAAVGHTGGDGGDFGHLAPAAPAAAEMESNVESGNQKTELSSSRGMLLRSAAFLDIGLVSSGAQQTAAAGFVGQDVIMCLCAVLGAFLWVRLFDELARRDVLEQASAPSHPSGAESWRLILNGYESTGDKLSRKLVHISTGLLYFACWPLFRHVTVGELQERVCAWKVAARFLCALAPAANCVRMLALGTGAVRDDAAVKAISREGDPRELLRGPLYYAVVLTFVTVCFWRNSPVGGIAVALMCGGDGIADIAGRRLGSAKLPWNAHKSWAGSIAMFLLGTPLALATVYFFCALGFYACSWPSTVARVALIALAATLVESLPITDRFDDNLTVPLTAVALGSVLFAA
eukprot:jgi/Mesen1/579/ME000107S10811